MFNLNSQIKAEQRSRDAALLKLDQEFETLSGKAEAKIASLKSAINASPWTTCALGVGAGVALSTLLPRPVAAASNLNITVQPAPSASPPTSGLPTLMEFVMLAMNLLGPAEQAKSPDDRKHGA